MMRLLTLLGALVFALIGAGIVVLSVIGFTADRDREEEPAPTPLAVADFEQDGKAPADKRWLELGDGVLLWSEASVEVRVWKLKDGKKKMSDHAVFVPLVSKKAFDIGQKSQDDLKQPIQVARVYVRFKPGVADTEAPRQETAVDHRLRLRGMADTMDKAPEFLREGLAPKGSLKDPAKLLVIRYDEDPSSKNAVLMAHVCMGVGGLVLMLPLCIVLLRALLPTRSRGTK